MKTTSKFLPDLNLYFISCGIARLFYTRSSYDVVSPATTVPWLCLWELQKHSRYYICV